MPGFDQPSANTVAGTAINAAERMPAQFQAMTKLVKRGLRVRPGASPTSSAGTARIARISAVTIAAIVLRLRYCVARATFGADNGVAGAIACASVLADYTVLKIFGLAGF